MHPSYATNIHVKMGGWMDGKMGGWMN